MNLQLKKSLDSPRRNLTTLLLWPDFFFYYYCFFLHLTFSFFGMFSTPHHPWQGRNCIAVAATLPHSPQRGKYLCSEERKGDSREERKYGENSPSGVIRSKKQLLSLLLGTTRAGITQGEMCRSAAEMRHLVPESCGTGIKGGAGNNLSYGNLNTWSKMNLLVCRPKWINKAKEE